MDPQTVAAVDARLDDLARRDDLRLPWAIESGSRAWGFPSPDSDYDCRFIFVRRVERYLSPWPPRDVVETPLDAVFDVNGWDLRKAVDLLVRGNATVVEWLRSPIVYSGDETFRDAFLALADEVLDRRLLAAHYRHLGRRQWERSSASTIKKTFYALRPALALRWLRQHPDVSVPPMDVPTILDQIELPPGTTADIMELIERKRVTREAGPAELSPRVRQLIHAELGDDAGTTHPAAEVPADTGRLRDDSADAARHAQRRSRADSFVVEQLERLWR